LKIDLVLLFGRNDARLWEQLASVSVYFLQEEEQELTSKLKKIPGHIWGLS
jgi:hypothetical protein